MVTQRLNHGHLLLTERVSLILDYRLEFNLKLWKKRLSLLRRLWWRNWLTIFTDISLWWNRFIAWQPTHKFLSSLTCLWSSISHHLGSVVTRERYLISPAVFIERIIEFSLGEKIGESIKGFWNRVAKTFWCGLLSSS